MAHKSLTLANWMSSLILGGSFLYTGECSGEWSFYRWVNVVGGAARMMSQGASSKSYFLGSIGIILYILQVHLFS